MIARAIGITAVAFALAVAAPGAQAKGPIVVLDGIRLGQSFAQVRPHLGKSLQVNEFEDGWRAEAFERDGHYVVLEMAPAHPDVIVGIQIAGKSNPETHGLGPLDLGDPLAEAEALLGQPKSVKDAVDGADGKPVPDTTMYDYGDTSLEVTGGRITSIKTELGKWSDAADFPELPAFLATLRSGDPQRIAQVLSSHLTLHGESAWNGPMLDSLQDDARLREALFGAHGITSLADTADDGAMRAWGDDEGGTHAGYVFKFNDGAVSELVFVGGPEGWELYEVN